jgi:hypothetical protein
MISCCVDNASEMLLMVWVSKNMNDFRGIDVDMISRNNLYINKKNMKINKTIISINGDEFV